MAINLGPVQPHVDTAIRFLANMFGFKTVGGWRKADQFPDHPSGLAGDFMITDIGSKGVASKNPEGKAAGDALANYAVANAAALGVKYVIWNGSVWNPRQGWHPYNQAGQGKHDDHVHITWNPTPGTGQYTSVSAQTVGNPLQPDLTAVFKKINSGAVTLSVAFLGLGLIGAGVWLTVSPKATKALKSLPGMGG